MGNAPRLRSDQIRKIIMAQVFFEIHPSPAMDRLLRIPELVVGNICPMQPVSSRAITKGLSVEYDSIVNDRARLHLVYRVTDIDNDTAKLILEDFIIDAR